MRLYYTEQQLREEFNFDREVFKRPIIRIHIRHPLEELSPVYANIVNPNYSSITMLTVEYEKIEIRKDHTILCLWVLRDNVTQVLNRLGVDHE